MICLVLTTSPTAISARSPSGGGSQADHRRWRDRWPGRRFIRVRLQTNAGSLGRQKGLGIARECPAPRPSVVGDRALRDDATIGVDANLALDPVVSNLDKPADGRLGRLRREQPFGVGYGLDEVG
jgi:hypothetical protein